MKPPMTRHQKTTILGGIFWIVGLLAILQLWLLTVTMNAWLGGDASLVWPALAASVACLSINLWLLRGLYRLDKPRL